MRRVDLDGRGVDAVAPMLDPDYSRKEGEWVPNEFGGRENLEAISLLKELHQATLFFFQAEDGIRDLTVTGVQTCALPILASSQFILFLLSNPARQIFLELSPRAGEPGHYCARRNLRDLCYFLVGETFLVSQHQDLTKFRRQCIHCFSN